MGNLFYSGLGRVAPLSSKLVGVPVHFVQSQKIYVKCGGDSGCVLCQNSFKKDVRTGLFLLDYTEKDRQYLIKVYATVSEPLTRVMYAIEAKGLPNQDWIMEKSPNGRGVYIKNQEGTPWWYQNPASQADILKLWEEYKKKDISKFLARTLTPDEMLQVLHGTYDKDAKKRAATAAQAGHPAAPAATPAGNSSVNVMAALGGTPEASGGSDNRTPAQRYQEQSGGAWQPPVQGAGNGRPSSAAQPAQPTPQTSPAQGAWQPPAQGATGPAAARPAGTSPAAQTPEDRLGGLI